ncbi:hypothetical protein O6H91_06G045200 [Diphasiastrum complanatum]|uniref:Uncharacterized protein n=4 Tax=Diphasiastrum complanatum TaxID=34168 RepID=A0ACC2DDE1_DIPCM|nr:hypothetical protein O6H91_06G045200 [Diphasiastrum complanatum]KAJ7552172.1 hypothetical protein O6H91_06G045200 [Diphasiastrum complanatum]KAJ7552173.1 hypothetical protein O6H91_06G045200 [Diphasiastrum complanatum]KAJ7552174.1 hypothetical protein O6H91_06G045200 [Diphasiastrum complanatum]
MDWNEVEEQHAFVFLMARRRAGIKIAFLPALSTLFLLCALLLLGLALVSILAVRLVDLENVQNNDHHRPTSVASKSEKRDRVSALRHDLASSSISAMLSNSVWNSKNAALYDGCSTPSKDFRRADDLQPNGYLMIVTSGGLNQQRTGITDAVVVARLLNATLVVPDLDHRSYWKDNSNFSDIFDIDWFIKVLAPDVLIVKKLPSSVSQAMTNRVVSMRVPRKCTQQYYQSMILPILKKKHVLQLTKFDYRLSNILDLDYQKLRCRVNYNALRFTEPISDMGHLLIKRIRRMSSRYIALHLRFEPDMLAFSGCYYGGGEKEVNELGAIRKQWKTLNGKNPEKERRNGKCPLTPEEVGLMLKAFGFANDSVLYVASGEVYGGGGTLAPLIDLFPKIFTKETLTSKEELQPFLQYSSRMAAIDYIVCAQSDVLVTNNNGNMARILAGQRRYFGHKRTIRPNTKKLGPLFLARSELSWEQSSAKVRAFQKGFMGEPNETKRGRGEFHENPAACICENSADKEKLEVLRQLQANQIVNSNYEDFHNIEHDTDELEIAGGQPENYKAHTDSESLENKVHIELPDGTLANNW